MTETQARHFAHEWITAWNSHDLDAIMSHYAADIVLISPVAARLLNDPSGRVAGKEAVLAYFSLGLQAYPNLTFTLLDVMWGISSIVLYYVNQSGTKCGEFMNIDSNGKVLRVIAQYNA